MIGNNRTASEGERLEKHQQQQLHQTNLATMDDGGMMGDTEYLQELTDNQLDSHTVVLMQNLVGQDFLLSNLKGAEINEIKWLSRSMARKVKRMHPPQESFVTGERRKVLLDDDRDGLKPLTPHQENLVDQALMDFFTRVARSRDGWQQDEMGKQLRVSRTEDDSGDESEGGFFL